MEHLPMRREYLELPRAQFLAAMDLLHRTATRFERDEVVISFDGAYLHLDLGGATTLVPAKGYIDGQFRMLADLFFYWLKAPPRGDPILFEFEENRLISGRQCTRIRRQPPWSKVIDIPINFSKLELALLYIYKYEHEQDLVEAGLMLAARKAYEDFQQALEKSRDNFAAIGVDIQEVYDCMIWGAQFRYRTMEKVE
ncbi:MAG: hypothetical protein N3J91_07505 [Verrucomicrobiae bacterium]|nr:hypothetical protein [Verrucomicrobiae bacterium]